MRLIDADALSKDLEKRWNINDDQDFCNKEVWHALEEAPTIEPDGDTISIQMAIEHWGRSSGNLTNDQIAELQREIESLPSATSQNLTKPNKSCEDDLISRADAIALVIKAIHGTDNKEIKEYLFDGLRKQMWSLPSAESTGAMDEAIQKYIKDGYMQPIGEDLISRHDVLNMIIVADECEPDLGYPHLHEVVENIPSADAVEVVRCKDCIVSETFQSDSNGTTERYCKAFTHLRMVADDDYCSYGERR